MTSWALLTLQPLVKQFLTADYVCESNLCAKFDAYPSVVGFLEK